MATRAVAIAAWVLSAAALYLALSGWFASFGLGLGLVALMLARSVRVRGATIVSATAICVGAAWLLLGLVTS